MLTAQAGMALLQELLEQELAWQVLEQLLWLLLLEFLLFLINQEPI